MFTLDWATANLDGTNTVNDGDDALGITVSTPFNDGSQWISGFIAGDNPSLRSSNVREPNEVSLTFDEAVENVSFEIYDVDAGDDWDDKVTIIALDADGNQVDVSFSNTESYHNVDGNTVEAEDNTQESIEGPGAPDSINVSIAGPIVSLTILHDNGDDFFQSGTIGLSDITIGGLAGPELDGIVEGTDEGELIDEDYLGDPEGDRVDNEDNIDPDATPEELNDDVIEAGGGDDTILAGEGSDTVDGGEGDDSIISGDTGLPDRGYPGVFAPDDDPENDRDLIDGGLGDDTILSGDDADTILGGLGEDVVDGGFDDDEIDGGEGNDDLTGGEGADTILGGEGDDTLDGGASTPEELAVLPDDAGDLDTTNDEDSLDGGEGDDLISGGDDDDTLIGGIGDDTLDGGIDDDELFGGEGEDELLGGEGDDLLDGGDDDDTLDGGDGANTLEGGAGDDSITGGDDGDQATGGDGDDTLLGGDGDDTLDGDDGQDSIEGGDGDDVIDSGTPVLTGLPDLGYPGLVSADPDPENDRDFVDGGDGDDDISTGDDADTILGGEGDDTIDAGLDADEIEGGDGDDDIIGGEGSDTIFGGDGDDTIFAGLGDPTDILNIPDDGIGSPFGPDLVPNNGQDLVDGGDGNDLVFGEDDDDTLLGGDGDDTLDGGIDEDSLEGGDGEDSLIGGDGDDTLLGGDGADTLEGGKGNDLFDLGGDDGDGDIAIGGDDRDTFTNIGPGDEAVIGGEGGDDFDVLDLTGAGPLQVNFTNDDPATESGTVDFFDGDGNVTDTLTFAEIEQVIPCFTPGTRVATPKGEVAVETLQAGDKVLTRDNGIQTISWIGHKWVDGTQLAAMPQMRPILIKAGSLGENLPERDMLVSPNHRMLVAHDRNALYFDEREVLVAAKHLVDGKGVLRASDEGVTYIHFMFNRHEVVLADGAWTESFQPGDYSLAGLDRDQRDEIVTLFPELGTQAGREDYTSARRTLKRHEALLLSN